MKLLPKTTGDSGMELPSPLFSKFLYTYLFSIKISLIFHLLLLYLTCSCPCLHNNIMVTAVPMYQTLSTLVDNKNKRGVNSTIACAAN